MDRLAVVAVLCLLAGVCAVPQEKTWPHKIADKVFLQRQLDVFQLFYHISAPNTFTEEAKLAKTWDIEKNLEHYSNVTAVKLFVDVYEYGMLPRGQPFSFLYHHHKFEATTLFHLLFSAKDWTTFYRTALWARDHVNEGVFVYALSVAILHRPDTRGFIIPPIYEIFPHFFFDTEIMTTAQKLNVYGDHLIDHMPHVHRWNNDLVIDANYTGWNRWWNEEHKMTYFTHDIGLNSYNYYFNLDYPSWLGGEVCPLVNDRRGEWSVYVHQQLLARYYLERLSNGLGEIPNLSWAMPIEHGYDSGLVYETGVEFPDRPNHFDLSHPEFLEHLIEVEEYERRIMDAIDLGWIITESGERVYLRTPESIEILGRVLESNVDSPNTRFYRDFITIAKYLLGNGVKPTDWHNVVPSVLEHPQTVLRDPVFYQLWKRIMNNIVIRWQQHLPMYRREELVMPDVNIKSVEVDKFMTYFEHFHVNITNCMWMNRDEVTKVEDDVSVLVRQTRLNHKVFNVHVDVHSGVAKPVEVKFFLGPKYDSHGRVIPLHENRWNFVELDHFIYDLKQGDNVIERSSLDMLHTVEDWTSGHELYEKVYDALHGSGKFHLDMSEAHNGWPQRLLLPKGTRSGMPFVFLVYIQEHLPPKVAYGTGFDPVVSTGLASGARFLSARPFGFPLERTIYDWTVEHIHNWFEKDVIVYHKHTPELSVPHHD